jgi:transposase-like protein
LSKYDKIGLNNLSYNNWNEAYEDISQILDVKKNSVRNWRDEFDVLHEHRKGWHQRPLSPSRKEIVNLLKEYDEKELRELVFNILLSRTCVIKSNNLDKSSNKYLSRATTGQLAELEFKNYFKKSAKPVKGELIDVRDTGCGCDFKIKNGNDLFFIEVKGRADERGAIQLTNKEWELSKIVRYKYYLVIISNLNRTPKFCIIKDPFKKFNPELKTIKLAQVSWNISEKEIKRVSDEQ